ncbi:hypothetical protein [Kribbella sp. CA-293567]|uniref:hypothetical protein n=1 Tax=Kribbella sp. CA-293567 TaxID=3002436 RepID=UPI0022DE741E|nr:hypothetical protein [Kribbella sp. CA-293567]WBQ02997.1 hypothetical protein OX958_23805 [Kribbella sp. CA-293567]
MATELMQFGLGDEDSADKVWFTFDVGARKLTIATGDSRGYDSKREVEPFEVEQLNTWLAAVVALAPASKPDDDTP